MATKKTVEEETVQEEVKVTKPKSSVFLCTESAQVKRDNKIITVFAGQKITLLSTDEYKEDCFKEVKAAE